MGISERRQLEKEAIKKKIIDAAHEILIKDGFENLSIRKIASKIEYSPSIIYHYFKDKAEIVSCVVDEGYGKILQKIGKAEIDRKDPINAIESVLRAYIELVMENQEQFKAILLNDLGDIQDKVNMLDEGISKYRKSVQSLCEVLELGMDSGKIRRMDIELTAQIIWTSTHGLVSRLLLEKKVPLYQKERLINHHFEILMRGLINN